MHRDGWRLVVAPSPVDDARREWELWVELRGAAPTSDDVRVHTDLGADGDWSSYWVRDQGSLREAERVVVVSGASFDTRRRANNVVEGTCAEPDEIEELLQALGTSEGERPHLMTPGSPTLALLRGRSDLIAAITVVGDRWIRCPEQWSGDAELIEPQRLQRWLEIHAG